MNLNKEYILITGCAGFIGMHLTIKFIKNKFNVVGLDNENSYYDVDLKKARLANIESFDYPNFKYIKCDLNDDKAWEEISKFNIVSVFHLAAQAGVRYSITNPWAYINSNILGFQKLLDYIVKNKIEDFFYASSSSVYGKTNQIPFNESNNCNKPESYYAATKLSNEMIAYAYSKTHNLKSVGLRFFTVYGPWGRPDMAPFLFVKAAFENKKIKVFNYGNQQRDFTYVDDIIHSIFLLYKNKIEIKSSTVYNIGNGLPVNLKEFIKIIEEETNSKLKKEYVEAQKGDVEITYADTSNLYSIIKFKPEINLRSGIRSFVNWYKNNQIVKNK